MDDYESLKRLGVGSLGELSALSILSWSVKTLREVPALHEYL
jgi:hypothetical protein